MADLSKMDRTWLCSVVFMDIVNYSSRSVELQMKWKTRFNGYLAEAIQDVPESERVILDTGDGAAVCFLGAPEAAMFAALHLCRAFALDAQEQQPGLHVRIGINLGPVKLVKDINGALNALGDGINAGQRIMSFASENQILVSQSFFEVVSRLSDDYKQLFRLKGVETDKHVREHTVYRLLPPGSEKPAPASVEIGERTSGSMPAGLPGHGAKPQPAGPARKSSAIAWIAGVAALVFVLAAVAWYFYRPAARPNQTTNAPAARQDQTNTSDAARPLAPTKPDTTAAPAPPAVAVSPERFQPEPAGTNQASSSTESKGAESKAAESSVATVTNRPPALSTPSPSVPSAAAKAAYDEASRLMDDDKAAEAVRHFDDAIRANPDYGEAYLGRAQARRILKEYELSIPDCTKAIQFLDGDARGYSCRGFAHQLLKQYDQAVSDLSEAIRINPNFAIAYEHRGTTYMLLEQYDHAVQDYSRAISMRPRNVDFHMRRAAAYSELKLYDQAIRDYSECIRLDPNNSRAYRERASAEEAAGDAAGAEADRLHARQVREKKSKSGSAASEDQ